MRWRHIYDGSLRRRGELDRVLSHNTHGSPTIPPTFGPVKKKCVCPWFFPPTFPPFVGSIKEYVSVLRSSCTWAEGSSPHLLCTLDCTFIAMRRCPQLRLARAFAASAKPGAGRNRRDGQPDGYEQRILGFQGLESKYLEWRGGKYNQVWS